MEKIKDGKLRFFVEYNDYAYYYKVGGGWGVPLWCPQFDTPEELEDWVRECVHIDKSYFGKVERADARGLSPDFDTLEEAVSWARERAAENKIEIIGETHHGNGKITRCVYEICAQVYDMESNEWIPCSYNGEKWEDNDNNFLDVADLHPEIHSAWLNALSSYESWLSCRYFLKDNDMRYLTLADALADELGEDWDELDYIERKFE